MRKLVTLDNDKIMINDKKIDMNERNKTNDNTLNVSDDELTHLNNTPEDGKKILIAGLIIENTFTSILDMVFVIIDEFLKSRQQNNNDDGLDDIEMDNNINANENIDFNGSTKMARFLRVLR
eukprot:UN13643